jgi:hypothetical protein
MLQFQPGRPVVAAVLAYPAATTGLIRRILPRQGRLV